MKKERTGIMNLTYLYQNNILIYAMLVIGCIGLLADFICSILYQKLLKASLDMGNSENKLLKLMKLRFETCYQLKLGVNNVDSFVDKYVNRHKFCGIFLCTWERICGQMIAICMTIAIVGSFAAFYYDCGQRTSLYTLGMGIIIVTMLIAAQIIFDISKKKQFLYCNIKEYLENYLKAKLENELLTPEEMEAYRNAYFEEDREGKKKERALAAKKEKEEAKRTKVEMAAAQEQEKIIEEILREYLA